jgi:hypothetical protein
LCAKLQCAGHNNPKKLFFGQESCGADLADFGNCALNNNPRDGIFEILGTIQIVRSIPTPRNSKKIFAGIVLRITTGAEKSEILQKSRKILKKSNCAVNNNTRRKLLKLCRD